MFTVKSQFVASHTGVLSALFTPKRGLGRTGCDTSTIKATTTSTEMSVIQAALPKGGVFVKVSLLVQEASQFISPGVLWRVCECKRLHNRLL